MPRRKQTQGEKKIDISQMAEDLGVSKTTVSRALSGNGRVSEATRARVVQYAKEKNYLPNIEKNTRLSRQSLSIHFRILKNRGLWRQCCRRICL